jgi:hypothetical protein
MGAPTSHPRRLPAPWSVRELDQAFVVSDASGQALAYVYFRRDENAARQAKVLTPESARQGVSLWPRHLAAPWSGERVDEIPHHDG